MVDQCRRAAAAVNTAAGRRARRTIARLQSSLDSANERLRRYSIEMSHQTRTLLQDLHIDG